jgi:ATP-dependent Lhr-like helicase
LRYIVIDELHAFIGSERGKQLQSLMHRVDISLNRTTPRIALSATLGDMGKAAEFLRPKSEVLAEVIESKNDPTELRVLVKGYVESDCDDSEVEKEKLQIYEHLFKTLRGSNNLIFANGRGDVEYYADALRRKSEQYGDNQFFAHHGNLSKEIRTEAEKALKSEGCATVICTTTLELGINIGSIKNVAQIGVAPSVSSLRQRLGRSGRLKGEPAVLWGYVMENEIEVNSTPKDYLHENLVQFIAQIRLLIKRWYEPPRIENLHLSTFIQQLLSLIAQYGGLNAATAWTILCEGGVFQNLNKSDFILLLRALGEKDILIQTHDGLLLHGFVGERIVNDYKFYATFMDEPQYRIVNGHRTLGTLSDGKLFKIGDYIIFAGRRWEVRHIDLERKILDVIPAPAGIIPVFGGGGNFVDDRVRQEMFFVLSETNNIPFLDKNAENLLNAARLEFRRMGLGEKSQTILNIEKENILIFHWHGSRVSHTICLILGMYGFETTNQRFYLEVKASKTSLLMVIKKILESPLPDEISLVMNITFKQQEKWDYLLPEPLLSKNYASSMLDIEGAIVVIKKLLTCF